MGKEIIKPADKEIIKNRLFGMPITYLSRHQRVAFTAFIKIAYEQLVEDKARRTFEYDTKEFFNLIGISKKRKQSHLFSKIFVDENGWEQESEGYALEKSLRELLKKDIVFRKKDEKKKVYEIEACVLISYFKLNRDKIIFRFDDWIRENILVAGNAYIMKMPIISKLKRSYSVALYEQIEQRRDFGKWEIEVNILRKLLGVTGEKYKTFNDFRRYCIERAINEINSKTDLIITEREIVKKGRKVEKIIFRWLIEDIKLLIKKIKKEIKKSFINIPIIKLSGLRSGETTEHVIAMGKNGKLYSQTDFDFNIDKYMEKKIWKLIAENKDNLLININAQSIKIHF